MPLATDVEVRGTDGVWRVLNVTLALRNKGKKPVRCVACKGYIKLHDAAKDGSMAAYVEHARRWEGCPGVKPIMEGQSGHTRTEFLTS